ncbi:MAG: formylmethanofuran dehydrogenase subunit C [Planctomycetaceae bacterium]|nr:formylmethanofuran dehydrogenase subunit C [Planctomycetaceae bacterium]
MTLKLTYQGDTKIPVEIEGITPDIVQQLSLAEIEQLPVFHGKDKCVLADFFKISGDSADLHMHLSGQLTGVHWIGTKMQHGSITIDGDCGRHLGSEMRGGTIIVNGNAGDWIGGEMKGGLIHVHGNAGHQVGAAYRGSERGMNRGTIIIDGNAGNEIGLTMRRGLIVIGGNAGDLIGFNMLAGTVMIFGSSGIRHGAGMRRGSIIFMGEEHPQLLPSFRHAVQYQPEFMRVMLRKLADTGFHVTEENLNASYNLYHGDMIDGGRGEILLRT